VHNPELHALVKKVERPPDENQQALIVLMDSLAKRSKTNQGMAA
jgi:hypothetical protein